MDINTVRIGFTLFSFSVFVGLVFWAWNRRRQEAFDSAARLPFIDSELDNHGGTR